MKRAAVVAILAVVVGLGSGCGGGTTGVQTQSAEEAPRMTMAEFRRWQRRWDRRLRDMAQTDPSTYAWGQETNPGGRVFVLDPPLAQAGHPEMVTVEWFHSPIDERNRSWVWWNSLYLMLEWKRTVLAAVGDKMAVLPRLVSQGPGVPRQYEPQLRLMQDMVNQWGENAFRGNPWKVYKRLTARDWNILVLTDEDALEIISEAGLSARLWRLRRNEAKYKERAAIANERFNEAMRRAAETEPAYLETPQDPILLIDGQYLLTGYIAKRTGTLFKVANRIIREQIGEENDKAGD